MSSIISVNVGQTRTVEFRSREVPTGIYKFPVEGAIRVEGVNLVGDDQADRSVHGGPDKAIYAYASEDYDWWSRELVRSLPSGTFGENLTTQEVDVGRAVVGQHWRIGEVVLEVSEPRLPCYKLGIRMEDARFPKTFSAANRPGTYLRILEVGWLTAGDEIEIDTPPEHGVTIADVARIYDRDRHEAGRLLAVPQLSLPWKEWALGFDQG